MISSEFVMTKRSTGVATSIARKNSMLVKLHEYAVEMKKVHPMSNENFRTEAHDVRKWGYLL